jgi:hypothetical protein
MPFLVPHQNKGCKPEFFVQMQIPPLRTVKFMGTGYKSQWVILVDLFPSMDWTVSECNSALYCLQIGTILSRSNTVQFHYWHASGSPVFFDSPRAVPLNSCIYLSIWLDIIYLNTKFFCNAWTVYKTAWCSILLVITLSNLPQQRRSIQLLASVPQDVK